MRTWCLGDLMVNPVWFRLGRVRYPFGKTKMLSPPRSPCTYPSSSRIAERMVRCHTPAIWKFHTCDPISLPRQNLGGLVLRVAQCPVGPDCRQQVYHSEANEHRLSEAQCHEDSEKHHDR